MNVHETVLLNEAVDGLAIKENGIYIDATYGRGGHSREILSRLGKQGYLLAFDRDDQAIASIPEAMKLDKRFESQRIPFSDLDQAIKTRNLEGKIDGILFDLGVSSPQLDDAARGFSFLKDGPLDMRMDTTTGCSAQMWVNSASVEDMAWVFKTYGEERFAKRIAKAIDLKRQEKKFATTLELAAVIKEANPAWEKNKHPATRVFQAIRIQVNQELDEIKKALEKALFVLSKGGRLVVISFHSLEDRIVKHFMREKSRGDFYALKGLPIKATANQASLKTIGKAIFPSEEEIERNLRARSAVMRIAEKI